MLSEKLKKNTKTAHQELEKLLVQNIKSIRTTEDYLDILGYFYRFFAPLENEIFSQLECFLSDIKKRRKTEWIVEDLNHFQVPHPGILSPPHILSLNNQLDAIGALYVIEGSTLGGQVICKMIAQKLGVSTNVGFKFFSGYGADTHKMWGDFKYFLNSNSWAQEEERAIIGAANRTFVLFKQSIPLN